MWWPRESSWSGPRRPRFAKLVERLLSLMWDLDWVVDVREVVGSPACAGGYCGSRTPLPHPGAERDCMEVRGIYPPWHFLYFLPLPQGHFSLRPILRPP